MSALAKESSEQEFRIPNMHLEHFRISEVMRGFFKKQGLLREAEKLHGADKEAKLAEANKIFCGVFFSGGGLAVSTQIGFAEMIHKIFGDDGTINAYVGASGGAIVETHSATGDYDSVSILPEVCESGFVEDLGQRRKTRPWQRLNYDPLMEVLRRYPVDQQKIRAVRSDVYAITIERDAGSQGEWHAHNMKEEADIEAVLAASSHIPAISRQDYAEIDGVKYNDGGLIGYPLEFMDSLVREGTEEVYWLFIDALPIERTQEEYAVANFLHAIGRRIPGRGNKIGLSYQKVCNDATRDMLMRHWLEDDSRVENYGILAPLRVDVGPFDHDRRKIELAIEDSREAAEEFFNKYLPSWWQQEERLAETA